MKKYIISIFTFVAILSAMTSCTEDLFLETGDYNDMIETVHVNLSLNVTELSAGELTRSEVPSDIPETATDAENRVNDVWLLQYVGTSQNLIYYTYLPNEKLADLDNIKVELAKVNDCFIYAITNTGNSSWINSSNKDNFITIDKLKEQTLPKPEPIYATELNSDVSIGIPMSGVSDEVTITEGCTITIPVTRMYAKLMINAVPHVDEGYSAEVNSVSVGAVPSTCAIETLYTGVDTAEGEYSESTKYYPWSFKTSQVSEVENDPYPYVIYVPENIKGEKPQEGGAEDSSKKSDYAPDNAMYVTAYLDFQDNKQAHIQAYPHYTVYPGGNDYDNFNVRRNCVYRVTLDITLKDVLSPSANCLLAKQNETIAFYPYYRDEVGHTEGHEGEDGFSAEYYTFSNHLSPATEDNGYDDSKSIKGMKIIWQTQDAIGDNSKYDLVKFEKNEADPIRSKIYVQANKEGNALIAAYNNENPEAEDAKILWSWHIWITDNNPADVNNALTYSHYAWDPVTGIDPDTRVIGYPVMKCNLGALANEPASTSWDDYTKTYGTLYEWGRKDPFPPVKTDGKYTGISWEKQYYGYNDEIGNVHVYDNNNRPIDLTGNTGLEGDENEEAYKVFNTILTTDLPTQTQEYGLQYSIENPTKFIAASTNHSTVSYYVNYGDWLPGSDDDLWGGNAPNEKKIQILSVDNGDYNDAYLEDNYGEYKTIFDPCPYGWRVSPGDLWLGFTNDGLNHYWLSGASYQQYINCSEDNWTDIRDNMGYHMYMNDWKDGEVSFFPTQGSRTPAGDCFNGGICGNYMNATVDDLSRINGSSTTIKRVDILHIHCGSSDGNIKVCPFEDEIFYFSRATCGPVRCVRDATK
ncbi:MAG: DUF4906 domain-containing protein [Prevotella sp.]|nr:DUF4906 domain-containing protein [Prevotella sp.]